jgi:hypothetical protein
LLAPAAHASVAPIAAAAPMNPRRVIDDIELPRWKQDVT